MYAIIHVDEKGLKRERHEQSTNGMLAVMAEIATRIIATGFSFTYSSLQLPSIHVDNGHHFYVERHSQH